MVDRDAALLKDLDAQLDAAVTDVNAGTGNHRAAVALRSAAKVATKIGRRLIRGHTPILDPALQPAAVAGFLYAGLAPAIVRSRGVDAADLAAGYRSSSNPALAEHCWICLEGAAPVKLSARNSRKPRALKMQCAGRP